MKSCYVLINLTVVLGWCGGLIFHAAAVLYDDDDNGSNRLITLDGHIHNSSEDDVPTGPQIHTLKPDTDAKASSDLTSGINGRLGHAVRSVLSRNSDRRTTSTVPPRVDPSMRKSVEWFEDTQFYALKSSPDSKFRIRYAPIPAPGSPWPMPQVFQPTNTSFRVAPANIFEFHSVGEQCALLEDAFVRFRRNVFGLDQGAVKHDDGNALLSDIHSVNVTVLKECTLYPYLDMDESYDLEVKRSGVSIITREVWGALRGLETLSQLIYHDEEDGSLWVNKTYIRDSPRFKHRGILLDTSRHYLDKKIILANLEAMAANKMNVFHWHIVDDQSFPYESKVFPNLSLKGAYHPRTHIYTHDDIAEIIEQARLRGIRVIPEFDSPGHTFSWGFGQDHLLTPCYNYRREPNGMYGPVNPILKKTYAFMYRLYKEVMTVFKDKYVHLGGDEVPLDCWQSNPNLLNFMKRNNISDTKELLSLYERELLNIISDIGEDRDVGAGYIVWQELFDSNVKLKPDAVVQIWSGDSYDIDKVTKAGFRALFSTCWYLDYISYGQDWEKYYKCEQVGAQLDEYRVRNQSLLIGGEACLWTEYADDDSIMPRLWPRASAAAERLWSDRNVVDVHTAAPRIEEQRCRMLRRGLQVGVLSGPGHCPRYKQLTKPSVAQNIYFAADVESNTDVVDHRKMLFKQGHVQSVNFSAIFGIAAVVCVILLAMTTCRGRQKALLGMAQRRRRHIIALVALVLVWLVCSGQLWIHSSSDVRSHAHCRDLGWNNYHWSFW